MFQLIVVFNLVYNYTKIQSFSKFDFDYYLFIGA